MYYIYPWIIAIVVPGPLARRCGTRSCWSSSWSCPASDSFRHILSCNIMLLLCIHYSISWSLNFMSINISCCYWGPLCSQKVALYLFLTGAFKKDFGKYLGFTNRVDHPPTQIFLVCDFIALTEVKVMIQCWVEQLFSLLGKKVKECPIIVTSMRLNEVHQWGHFTT